MYKYFLIVLLATATTHAQIEPMASRRYVDQATNTVAALYGPRIDLLEAMTNTWVKGNVKNTINRDFELWYAGAVNPAKPGIWERIDFTPRNLKFSMGGGLGSNVTEINSAGIMFSSTDFGNTYLVSATKAGILISTIVVGVTNSVKYAWPTGVSSSMATLADIAEVTAPMLLIEGTYYRQYWDTNLLTTAWEPVP